MRATFEFPDTIFRELESIARREGATPGDLIRRLVEDHLNRRDFAMAPRQNVRLPLIPESETGVIPFIKGAEVDEILSRDHLPA